MKKRHLYALTGILTGLGLSLFLYKAIILSFPVLPDTQSEVWNVEARLTLEGEGKPVKVTLYLPRNTLRYSILNEHFISGSYGLSTTTEENNNRQAIWSIRQANGRQALYYRATIARLYTRTEPQTTDEVIAIIKPNFDGPYLKAAQTLVGDIRARSADTDTLVAELLRRLQTPETDANLTLLLGNRRSQLAKMKVAAQILALADMPARVVHGIRLEEQRRDAPVSHWLQVHNGKIWRTYDPNIIAGDKTNQYLTWWRGDVSIAKVQGAKNLHVNLSVNRNQEPSLTAAARRGRSINSQLISLSLFSLPIETQAVYRILLTLPIGALILVLLRNVIGIKTFGTFMPVLIALAFRETQLLWGIALFSIVVGLGLMVRFYLDRLKLLLVPRLAAVLITVVLLMAILSVASHAVGLERGLSVALFPMVILTMTIERMSIVWDERGVGEALLQGIGSLLAASIAYLIMFQRHLEHLVFVFPELLLLLLAVTLLLGRYSGYRLTELFRFKVLAKGQ
jgi:hypothetical protein